MNSLQRQGDIDFYVTPTYTLQDLRKVQARGLEMYRQVSAILDRHDVSYTLGYGSLLGQIRHSGYIPWDDDVDLFILSEDYARAIWHLRQELSDDLLLHNRRNDPVYWVKWVKVRDLKTSTVESMWEMDRKLKYHGVCIDLIPLATVAAGKYLHEPKIKAIATKLQKLESEHRGLGPRRRLSNFPRLAFARVKSRLRKQYYEFLIKRSTERLLVAAPGTIIERSFRYNDMYPIRSDGPPFEGIRVNTPNNPDGVLRAMYGDYLTLPPLDERLPHHESVQFFD